MDDKLSIRLNIADRIYPLKIKRADEEKLRKAARMINDDLKQYGVFTEKDLIDKLAILALNFVIKLIETQEASTISPALQELLKIDASLGNYIERKTQT